MRFPAMRCRAAFVFLLQSKVAWQSAKPEPDPGGLGSCCGSEQAKECASDTPFPATTATTPRFCPDAARCMQQMPQVHNGCQPRCCYAGGLSVWHKSLHLHVLYTVLPPDLPLLGLFLRLIFGCPVVLQLCTLLFALHALARLLPIPLSPCFCNSLPSPPSGSIKK